MSGPPGRPVEAPSLVQDVMKEFLERYKMYIGAIVLTLGLMASWQSLDFLPRWAWYTEVQSVQADLTAAQAKLQSTMQEQIASNADFAKQTRLLVLGQEWERLDREIERLEAQPSLSTTERELLSKKRLRKQLVEQQIRDLQREM